MVGQALRLVFIGVVLGLGAAMLLTRSLDHLAVWRRAAGSVDVRRHLDPAAGDRDDRGLPPPARRGIRMAPAGRTPGQLSAGDARRHGVAEIRGGSLAFQSIHT
jgi:hypothetical protein